MASQLPSFPHLVFTKLEPLSLVAGFLGPMLSVEWFINTQIPFTYITIAGSTVLTNIIAKDATAQLLAGQLGNAYLLLGILGVFILNTTTEIEVVHAYLWALWLGDIGHVGLTLYSMGWYGTLNLQEWGAVTWANVGFTTFLFLTRSLYFLGFFGGGVDGFSVEPRQETETVAEKEE